MQLSWPKPNRTFGFIDALGITGVCGFLVARFIPVAKLPFWGCAFRELTGWPCPGCGLTRVADRFAHGHFAGAWDANPLGTVAAGAFLLCILLSAIHMICRFPIPQLDLSRRELATIRACIIALVVLNYAFMVMKAQIPGLL